MGSRDRNDQGEYAETLTERRVLGVFERVDGPVITSSDVADTLSCSTEAARRKLSGLYERGILGRRKTGRTLIYWLVEQGEATPIDAEDPFFAAEPAREGGPGDVAANVDEHLYDNV
ncbi:transcriptional regulator [Natranaeroarchaeum aerophilus]|uniref:Transcriptional regulator n=1 Tax=Natranaeroarchaeum aerophilus TaxID=2917711 RepID=A0AAE3FRN5_9EURY|nr:transcriptional regulator [Natranaeroarchaeum aerophilus]MCL9814073.1 transcriptional regulator [Natranaeroarchaeum aerophilus]